MANDPLPPGLYERLLTRALNGQLASLAPSVEKDVQDLADAEAADRLSRHFALAVARALEDLPERGRATAGAQIIARLFEVLFELSQTSDRQNDLPVEPAKVLRAILKRRPDGTAEPLEAPLTPLLDTTVLTNSRGEPALGHGIRAEIHSSDAIDVVMAFVRWSGIRPLLDALQRHCRDGKSLRLVTTTYTNSTELHALEQLAKLGADVKVSYDTADLYRQKVTTLARALEHSDTRTEATEALRGLIDAITLTPEQGELKIELKGNLAAMLSAATNAKRSPETGDLLVQIKLVAGACNRRYLQLWSGAA